MLRFLGFIFLFLIIISLGALYYYRTPLAEKLLTSSFHTEVLLSDVDIGWQKVTLRGLKIPKACLSVKRIAIEMPYSSLWHDEVEITSLTIEEPHLLPFIPKWPKSNSKRHFTIDRLVILNIHLPLGKKIAYLEWHALGKTAPFTFESMVSEILTKALSSERPPSSIVNLSSDELSSLKEAKKGLIDQYHQTKKKIATWLSEP